MYTIPENYTSEIELFRNLVVKSTRDQIDPVLFKVFRIAHGIYEQRKRGTYMVRIRCSGGVIRPEQLAGVSNLVKNLGSEFLHITTRQEIQLHNINLGDTPEILENLYKLGLTTKGGGGNTVRNITASIESGISADEVFDVTPYNISLTNFLLGNPLSFDLPRKFKIAFSCSPEDSALASFSDLGFIAKIQDGRKGFKVFIGGAPSVKPMAGYMLFDCIPADDIYAVTLSAIEVFNRYGNRKNRYKARFRYVFYKYGKDVVFDHFHEIYNQYRYKCPAPEIPKESYTISKTGAELSPVSVSDTEFETWKFRYVERQKQDSYCSVTVPVIHGNITPGQAYDLATFALNFGEDTIRFSRKQNIQLRNIPEEYIGNVYRLLLKSGFDIHKPSLLGNLVSCTGADTCQLGICYSKGGLQAVHERLAQSDGLDGLNSLSINISGCPNSCGQHLAADIGFAGKVSRKGKIYPAYTVYAGAVVNENGATLPEKLGEIAAKDLPGFTGDLLQLYSGKGQGRQFREFILDEKEGVTAIFDKYREIPDFEADKKYYIDWGSNSLFTLEAHGGGECSAGLADLIESEIKAIHNCKETIMGQHGVEEQTVLLYEIILASSKLLCYSAMKRYIPDEEIFNTVFERLVDKQTFLTRYVPLLKAATLNNHPFINENREHAIEFADAVINYYQCLDEKLQPGHDLGEITVSELHALLKTGSDIVLIDVREAWEKEIADIGGELIPADSIEEMISSIPRDVKTIIYCRTGRRSAEVIRLLADRYGFGNLYNLKGGIYAWADEIDKTIQKY